MFYFGGRQGMKVFVEQSFGKQYRPKWLWDQGAYKEWGKVRGGVVFVGSRALLRAGTLLRRGERKSCCTFLLVLTHLLC